jgi:hypothetical protein
MSISKQDLIFEQWTVKLKTKNRDKNHVTSNFLELFEGIKSAGVSCEDAHPYVAKAAKAHYPNVVIAKNTYKNYLKLGGKLKNEKAFVKQWQDSIDDKALEAFYEIYNTEAPPSYEDFESAKQLKQKYSGTIPESEYVLLRRYADQFEVLDTKELEEQARQGGYVPLDDDVFKNNVLGGNNGADK